MKDNRYAKCPFFISKSRDDKRFSTISCENPVSRLGFEVETRLDFKERQEQNDFYELFCCDLFRRCPYYRYVERMK